MSADELKANQARYLAEQIREARYKHYDSTIWGDRFDGTPNFDTREGEEMALRAFAAEYAIAIPTEAEAKESALSRLEELHPEDEVVEEFVETLRSGLSWDRS